MEERSLNSGTSTKGWGDRLSSHSGTLVLSGLILIGLIIAWLFGGFPSILLPSFIILTIGIPVELLSMIFKSTSKKKPGPVKPLKAVFILLVFFLAVEWFGNAGLSIIENPSVADKVLKKVEFPFSEASHVITDSEGSIYVFSQFNGRIQRYSEDGRFQFGWFSGGWKGIEMAIDENDFIYTYAHGSIVRQYAQNGNMIQAVRRSEPDGGWWRLKNDFVVWDSNAKEPEQHHEYNKAVKDGDLLPSTELRKTGFEAADGRYYKLTRLWYVFPLVSVNRYSKELEGYIMPNPLSLTFTFVFPGFLFYILTVIIAWILEKQAERFTRLKCALLTVATLIIAVLVIFIGTSLILGIANAQPKGSPLGFWLGLFIIPYLLIVVCSAAYFWQAVRRRLVKNPPTPRNPDFKQRHLNNRSSRRSGDTIG